MIQESRYWKEPLLEMAHRLTHFMSQTELTEDQFASIERDVFIGFYSVRRLFEASEKITDKTRSQRVTLRCHGNHQTVTRYNKYRLDELYDLEKSQTETRDIFFVCHRIIHSYIFAPTFDEKGFAGILFTSDIDKDKKLYLLTAKELVSIFELVGNDYPKKIVWERDESGNETLNVE